MGGGFDGSPAPVPTGRRESLSHSPKKKRRESLPRDAGALSRASALASSASKRASILVRISARLRRGIRSSTVWLRFGAWSGIWRRASLVPRSAPISAGCSRVQGSQVWGRARFFGMSQGCCRPFWLPGGRGRPDPPLASQLAGYCSALVRAGARPATESPAPFGSSPAGRSSRLTWGS